MACARACGHQPGSWLELEFPGDLRAYRSDTDAVGQFCGICGSTLTYELPRWPGLIDLSLANIEEPLDRAPGRHTYADRAPAWCPILDDLPRYGGPDGVQPL